MIDVLGDFTRAKVYVTTPLAKSKDLARAFQISRPSDVICLTESTVKV